MTECGKVYSWGDNEVGQCGLGFAGEPITTPQRILGLTKIVQVSCGYKFSAAVDEQGELYVWGSDRAVEFVDTSWDGGLDRNSEDITTPERVKGIPKVKQIACGGFHMLILTTDYKIYAWGDNSEGQLGVGNWTSQRSPVNIFLPFIPAFVACGGWFSAAISTEGELFMWGNNGHGQLGLGHTESSSTPVLLPNFNCKFIAVGASHCLALTNKNELWAWGCNTWGQVGTKNSNEKEEGDVVYYDSPQHVRLPDRALCIGCGFGFSFVVTQRGYLYLWGEDQNFEDWNPQNQLTPKKLDNSLFAVHYVSYFWFLH